MKRIIVDFKKMNGKLKNLFNSQYPDGFDSSDVIEYRNHKNELIKAIEVQDADHKYLVKLSTERTVNVEEFNTSNI